MSKIILFFVLSGLFANTAKANMTCSELASRASELQVSHSGIYEMVPNSCVDDQGTPDQWSNQQYKTILISVNPKNNALKISALKCGNLNHCSAEVPVLFGTTMNYLAQSQRQSAEEWPSGGLTCALPYEISLQRNISLMPNLVERFDELKSAYSLTMISNLLKFDQNGTLEWNYKTFDSFRSPMLSWFTRGYSKCHFRKAR